MTPALRFLFLAELAVCFMPITLVLIVGTIFLPGEIVLLAQGYGSLFFLLTTLGGLAGLAALFFVVRKILNDSARVPHIGLLWLMIGSGWTTLAVYLHESMPASVAELLLLGLPMGCTFHVIYLGRRILF